MTLQTIAHETSHTSDPAVTFAGSATVQDFLQKMMRNEARAVVNQLLVRDEILRNSEGAVDIGFAFAYPEYYKAAIDFYRQHGSYERLLQHVAQMYVCQKVCNSTASYWETYSNEYFRARNMPQTKVPFHNVLAAQAGAWRQLQSEVCRG